MDEPLQLLVLGIAIIGGGLVVYRWWKEFDEVNPGTAVTRSTVPTADNPAVVVEVLDATIYVSDDGVTFERAQYRASRRRRADHIVFAPWSSIVGATSTAKEIRIQVAGYSSPRLVTADPWGANLKKAHRNLASALVHVIWVRAAGTEAVPMIATASDVPDPTPTPIAPAHVGPEPETSPAPRAR